MIEMQGWTLVSFAGLNIDTHFRVLNWNEKPVKDLHAIGEVIGAGATLGSAYTNGMLVTPAITFRRFLDNSLGNP